ncbi:DUF86 domain-containing protein [Patescibacteria group bacterium]|nr:DUF86 domain-containing protein [Patescibacteria group bacterium]MDE1946508.1 DUF86 domain-containing protein [Patescibacteria group bacterium]MDE2011247.1 DUF86 domain-containing protein [Patescibacteria group bacterium]MDE2233330.1 DUF86 domain-containing protein [Patescibacteria group bacterium]
MFNADTVKDKLFRLKQNSDFIDDLMKNRESELRKDRPLYNGLEHLLQISIEIIIDIGSHLLAEGSHDTPSTYEQVILALGEYGIVNEKFAKAQADMARFRNLLVHDYDKTNPERVMEYAQKAPEIFRTFGKAFVDYMEKNSEPKKKL